MKSTFCLLFLREINFLFTFSDDEIYEEEVEDEMIQKLKKNNPNLIITPPTSPDDLPQNINNFTKFPAKNNRKTPRRVVKGNKFSPNNAQNEVVTLDESFDYQASKFFKPKRGNFQFHEFSFQFFNFTKKKSQNQFGLNPRVGRMWIKG